MKTERCAVAIVGSGAGGGTVAQALAPLVAQGKRVLVLERGPRFRDTDFSGRELDMAPALYADAGGFLTADGSMTLAFARGYGGSTIVYTGTSLPPPERVIRGWNVPGLDPADLQHRSARYLDENGARLLPPELLNDNNRFFAEGAARAGLHAEQFPLNLRGCRGSSLCNLGCPNAAKQGTNRVQLPRAERQGVEVLTRALVRRIGARSLDVVVSERPAGGLGSDPEWPPGEYRIEAECIVLAGGALGTPPLLLSSRLPGLPQRVGAGFTCHPAHILVGEHLRPISNAVGHPKSYYVDRAAAEGYVLETCMYFPFTTAKNLTGFGAPHSALMRAFPRLQMILVLACDRATAENRIGADREGNPVVHYRFTERVIGSLVAATRVSARIFFAAGALRVHAPEANPPLLEAWEANRIDERISTRHFRTGAVSVSAAHLMGGCAMGRDASDSVTDAWGRVHGMPWLRVADASLFPDALQINPYVTIMALADRVADGVREDLCKGLGS
ncbi:MAG TPA: GMC family oxidoreductase [Gemmatimonadales bacterium]|jgi:choline dehydrogenase-like flavoprotein|nr:GMC family oxidoreductase [Gemmatimonadales bacterium]